MLIDKPIAVTSKPLQLSGTIRGPIIPVPAPSNSSIVNSAVGINSSVYKVKLVANGKTFNMLLPPSIESKHPGRSNPLQLPGLQIKANINISKLKIPGFFPIYQNLGVESLTISMSGMFTGYDGTNLLSAANWENSVGIGQSNVEQGQDSFTSASELYEFAVNNKALVQVTIYTSDGSFIPKQSTSTAFRDNNSNISFKGYIKEFEQVYIRQDRNYYLLRFEIVDFGTNKCKIAKNNNKTTIKDRPTFDPTITNPITDEDRKYSSCIDQAQPIVDSINKGEDVTKIIRDIDDSNLSAAVKIKLTLYAQDKGFNTTAYLSQLNSQFNSDIKILSHTKIFKDGNSAVKGRSNVDIRYRWEEDIKYRTILCNQVKGTNCNLLQDLKNAYDNDLNNTVRSNSSTPNPILVTPTPTTIPSNTQLTNDLQKLNDVYNYKQQRGLIKDLKDSNGVLSDATMSTYAILDNSTSQKYTYKGNTTTKFPSDPQSRTYATFQSSRGDTLLLVPVANDFSRFKLVNPP